MRTYGALAFSSNSQEWVMDALEPHAVIRLKQLFPRVPKASAAPFVFANDLNTAADLEWFLQRYPLQMSAEDLDRLKGGRLAFDNMQGEMARILLPNYQPLSYSGLREGQAIRKYQAQAIEILKRSKGLALCDETGLGKSFVTAGAMLAEDALPGIIVCAPHLQKQWAGVVAKFTTLWPYCIRGTKPYSLPRADVYIFRYSQLVGWIDALAEMPIGLVAYDEVQELRSGTGTPSMPVLKGKAAKRLSAKAGMRLGLSATPIYNYGEEIFNIMSFINPAALGPREDFTREWCAGKHIKDGEALGGYLREQYALLRRTKRDVGSELPAVNRIVDVIDYDHAAVESIEALAQSLAMTATTGSFTERGRAIRELDMRVRQQTGVAKAKSVAAVVRILVEGGEPVVLFGWHREVYDIWNEELKDLQPAMYTGSETAGRKNAAASRFLSGDTDILIMSLRSGAGLDGLQLRASTAVFGELDWSPGVHHQCLGRLDREGQTQPVTALYLVVEDGSDPPMMEVLGLKASEQAAILDPDLGVQSANNDVSHLRSLVERYLIKKRTRA
jgi:superfamily II DNA or RNA helicase